KGRPIRQAAVLLVVMALAGLWHGANWTFVIWGAFWGLYILLARIFSRPLALVPPILRWAVHINVVMILWVFFRAPNVDFGGDYTARIFSFEFPRTSFVSSAIGIVGCVALMGLHLLENLTLRRSAIVAL